MAVIYGTTRSAYIDSYALGEIVANLQLTMEGLEFIIDGLPYEDGFRVDLEEYRKLLLDELDAESVASDYDGSFSNDEEFDPFEEDFLSALENLFAENGTTDERP